MLTVLLASRTRFDQAGLPEAKQPSACSTEGRGHCDRILLGSDARGDVHNMTKELTITLRVWTLSRMRQNRLILELQVKRGVLAGSGIRSVGASDLGGDIEVEPRPTHKGNDLKHTITITLDDIAVEAHGRFGNSVCINLQRQCFTGASNTRFPGHSMPDPQHPGKRGTLEVTIDGVPTSELGLLLLCWRQLCVLTQASGQTHAMRFGHQAFRLGHKHPSNLAVSIRAIRLYVITWSQCLRVKLVIAWRQAKNDGDVCSIPTQDSESLIAHLSDTMALPQKRLTQSPAPQKALQAKRTFPISLIHAAENVSGYVTSQRQSG